jgi:uncharacterized membrane protein (DUF485 family)
MNAKLLWGYGLGSLVLGYAVYAGHSIGADQTARTLNVLLCAAGGVFGWIAGTLITPRQDEKQEFSRVGSALMTFVTGFLLAKIEPLLDSGLKTGSDQRGMLIQILLFSVSFAVGAIFVFVGRRYWTLSPKTQLTGTDESHSAVRP